MPRAQDPERVTPSPFERLIAFEIFDGPTAGVLFSRGTDRAMMFRMLAWDDSRQQRVFALSSLHYSVVQAQVDSLSAALEPRWPEWWLQDADDEVRRTLVERAIRRIAGAAEPPSHVVLSSDLLDTLERVVAIESEAGRAEFDHLSERSDRTQEVSNGSFASWVSFIEARLARDTDGDISSV